MCWVKKELVDEGQNGDNLWKLLLHKRADVGDMFDIRFCNKMTIRVSSLSSAVMLSSKEVSVASFKTV